MKLTELRLNNLIYHEEDKVKYSYTVNAIFEDSVLVKEDSEEIKIGLLQPIPLTEEWLLRFGFAFEDMVYWFEGFDILHLKEEFEFLNHDYPIKIKHVHQLQNLFFSLTNEELTLKQ